MLSRAGNWVPFQSSGAVNVALAQSDLGQIPAVLVGRDVGTATHPSRYTSQHRVIAYPELDSPGYLL